MQEGGDIIALTPRGYKEARAVRWQQLVTLLLRAP